MSKVLNPSGFKARSFVKNRCDRTDATWQQLLSVGVFCPQSGHTFAVREEDLSLWHRGHSAVCHMWWHVTAGKQGDTQAWTKCPRWAGAERTGSVGTIYCSSRSRWAWGSLARRSGSVKKRRQKRTGQARWPGDVWTSFCLQRIVPPLLNRTAPDINTTLSLMSWRSPLRLLFTLKSWAGELTQQGSCCRVHIRLY